MIKATRTMHVDATPEQVMEFFVDPTMVAPGQTMDVVYETPDVEGTVFEWTMSMFGVPQKGVTVFTEYVPGERLTFRNFGAFEGDATWTLEPEDGGTKADVRVEARLAIPLLGRLFNPLLEREWEKNVAWAIEQIEQRAKREAMAPAA